MKLIDPLLHYLQHHVCEKENEIKFHYMKNSGCSATILFDDTQIGQYVANRRKLLCNGHIYGYNTCYEVRAIQ